MQVLKEAHFDRTDSNVARIVALAVWNGISRVYLEITTPDWNFQGLTGIYNKSTTDRRFQATIATITWETKWLMPEMLWRSLAPFSMESSCNFSLRPSDPYSDPSQKPTMLNTSQHQTTETTSKTRRQHWERSVAEQHENHVYIIELHTHMYVRCVNLCKFYPKAAQSLQTLA